MVKYTFELSEDERSELTDLVHKGKVAARKRLHAQILLLANCEQGQSARNNAEIAQILQINPSTVYRVCRRFVEEGMDDALDRRRHKNYRPFKLDGEKEAKLVMLACSQPPEGCARWTMQLLADRLVQLEIIDTISDETVRRVLKKTKSNPGRRSSGVLHPKPARSL